MEEQYFYHAIKIDYQKCVGCAHCMKVCPTEAIRIQDGKAILDGNRCVDCGECYRVCPFDAYSIDQDNLSAFTQFDLKIVLVPSVYYGQFPDSVSFQTIEALTKEIGFDHVFEIEASAELLEAAFNNLVADDDIPKPIISTFCPAIVRLIQVKFPMLVENIAPLRAPADISALYYRKHFEEKGYNPEKIGIFYFTPCAAKIAAFKSPVGEDKRFFDGIINMDWAYNKVILKIKQGYKPANEETPTAHIDNKSVRWCLTNGEAKNIKGRSLSIDGLPNVMEFLEKLENEEITGLDFLELRSCDESCAGGILLSGNRFLTVERMNSRAHNAKFGIQSQNLKRVSLLDQADYLNHNLTIPGKIEPRTIILDADRAVAMKKMQRMRDIMCFLPGIDCGACGSPTCKSLAEDIANRKAYLTHCVFMQRNMERHKKLNSERALKIIEKIWGSSRLEKDCTKKGAKYESR